LIYTSSFGFKKLPIIMKPVLVFSSLILALAACAPATKRPKLDPVAVERKMLRLQQNFNIIDSNKDDSVSPAEIKQAMIRSGSTNVSPQRINKVVKFYDFNRDGKIELREAQAGAVSGPEELIKEIQKPANKPVVIH